MVGPKKTKLQDKPKDKDQESSKKQTKLESSRNQATKQLDVVFKQPIVNQLTNNSQSG